MSKMKFKYEEAQSELNDCPPTDYNEIQLVAYRFVHEDLNNPDNFKPVKFIQPNRKFPTDEAGCLALGLSMFDKPEDAKGFYKLRLKKFPRFAKTVGTHLASLNIHQEDSVASKPEELNFGHFTFHEYLWCDFATKIIATELI